MELRNEFKVPGAPDDVFDVLLDLEQIAPCMPGAKLLEHDGDRYRGTLKLKVGPIAAAYEGTVNVEQVDRSARRAILSASGSEMNGQGSAEAKITAEVRGDDGASVVTVATDLQIRGKVAQFGRGVLGDVTQRVIDQFSSNLEARLLQPAGVAAAPTTEEAQPEAAEGAPEERAPSAVDESLDVLSVVVVPALRRGAPYLAVLLLGVLLGWLGRGRGGRQTQMQWPPYPPGPYPWPQPRSEG